MKKFKVYSEYARCMKIGNMFIFEDQVVRIVKVSYKDDLTILTIWSEKTDEFEELEFEDEDGIEIIGHVNIIGLQD